MSEASPIDQEFLRQVVAVIGDNLADEHFGVTELADKLNMSRSNLLIKVKKAGNISVNQLIKEVRLKQGMEMLKTTTLNVSEVAHKTGFNSSSYFIKCFREYYGYPPGEVGKRSSDEKPPVPVNQTNRRKFFLVGAIVSIAAIIIVSVVLLYPSNQKVAHDKSVLVLPFKNESGDSTNVYLINGLMESTLNNLQKIQDLRVLSRTSAEKYRNAGKSIPEMAKEMNVQYFIEGSGQKIGDQILLNIQLIDGPTDKHLWAKQYRREAKDIFELQQEIAENIAQEIKAVITPEEQQRIKKKPTENLVAYDLYLKGANEWRTGNREALIKAIPFFEKAVAEDDKFAVAYAALAISYYYMDIFQIDKKYANEINEFSDKALLLDPKSATCLMSKGMYYMHQDKPAEAIPYLEKALEYNPNYLDALNLLSQIYNFHLSNTSKHLKNALKAARLDMGGQDSVTASHNYMQLSIAFLQAGFNDEAKVYIDKAGDFDKNSTFVPWVKAAVVVSTTRDFETAKDMLVKVYEKDTNMLHIMQEIGKLEYAMGHYESAFKYLDKFAKTREAFHVDMFRNMDITIGLAYLKMGKKEEGEKFIRQFFEFAKNDKTIYKDLHLAIYYAYKKDAEKTIHHLEKMAANNYYQVWVLLFEIDESVEFMKDNPEFQKVIKKIETKFWDDHKKIRKELEEEGLI